MNSHLESSIMAEIGRHVRAFLPSPSMGDYLQNLLNGMGEYLNLVQTRKSSLIMANLLEDYASGVIASSKEKLPDATPRIIGAYYMHAVALETISCRVAGYQPSMAVSLSQETVDEIVVSHQILAEHIMQLIKENDISVQELHKLILNPARPLMPEDAELN